MPLTWPALVGLYPVLNSLAAKIPDLRKRVEDMISKSRPDGVSLLLHLEQMQQLDELRNYVLQANLASAKLANPDLDEEKFIKAWRFSKNLVELLKSV